MSKHLKVALTGMGNVNRPLINMLSTEKERLETISGVRFTVVGASDSKGAVVAPEGVAPEALLDVKKKEGTVAALPSQGRRGMTALEMIESCGADMLVECLPPYLPSGEPGSSHIFRALELSMHVVTANKAPLALHWSELFALAKEKGRMLRYGTAASAGLHTLEHGRMLGETGELLTMAGIFNASCKYVLDGMRDGMTFEQAQKGAQEGGFLEPNPAMDIDGWDAAMKTVIQANTYWGTSHTLKDVKMTGISHLTPQDMQAAARDGEVYCMVGRAKMTDHGLELSAGPERLPQDHTLAKARWCDKALLLTTRSQGEQIHYCIGASASATPGNTLMDMVLIARNSD